MSSFILGGRTAKELGLLMLRPSQRPLLPGTIDRIMDIPGRHGAWDFGADLQPRLFLLECAFITRKSDELQQRISDLAAYLSDENGRPRTMDLVFTIQPDRKFLVRYSGQLPIDRVAGIGRFTMPLVAYDPLAQSVVTNNEITWGSEIITFNSDYLMGHEGGETRIITSNESVNVVVNGTITVRPKITISGNGTNVAFSSNGNSFTLPSLDGSNWEVDCDNWTVKKDGLNALGLFEGSFIELFSGDNPVSVSGSNMSLSLQISFRDKYL